MTLLLVVVACAPSPTHDTDSSSSTTIDTPGGPEPGAPDENCGLDPARVYILEQDPYGLSYTLTDVRDRTKLCAYTDAWPGQLDPLGGQFIAMRGAGDGDVTLVEQHPDWLQFYENETPAWWNNRAPDNDVVLHEFGACSGGQTFVDDATIIAGCNGEYFNAPGLAYIDATYGPPIGRIDGRRIYASFLGSEDGYQADVTAGAVSEEDVAVIPYPEGVFQLQHLAARPDGDALLAAVFVRRATADTIHIERARVFPDRIELQGEYSGGLDAVPEVGVLSSFALAADGTLYATGTPADAEGFYLADSMVVEFPVDGSPRLVYQSEASRTTSLEWRPRLVAVGTGDPFRYPR